MPGSPRLSRHIVSRRKGRSGSCATLVRRLQRVNRNARPLARRRAHAKSCRTRRGGPLSAIVEFDSIGLRYGTGAEVLRDLDFRLSKGGFYFLTGPSGAGKTSLLKLLYLAQRPTRGKLGLFGEDLTDASRDALPH